MNLSDRELEKRFRQMVKEFDGEKAMRNVAGSNCEHYAIEFAKLISSSENPDSSEPKN
jgi:hypothetical protein